MGIMDPRVLRNLHKLIVAMYMMGVSGTLYAYGTYSDDIQDAFGLSDSEITGIIDVAGIGSNICIWVGFILAHGGQKGTSLIGGIIAVAGYVLAALSMNKDIGHSWGIFGLELGAAGQGCVLLYMAALVTYQQFPKEYHGIIIGCLDCMFGFSAGIFTLVYDSSFSGNVSGFMYCCGVAVGVAALLGVIFLQGPQKHENTTEDDKSDMSEVELLDEGPSYSALLLPRFWMLFIIFLLAQGIAFQVLNNAGNISTALHPSGTSNLKSNIPLVISISGGILRFAFGCAADYFKNKGFRVTLLLIVVAVFLLFSQFLLMVGFRHTMMVSAVFTGFSFGGQWCLIPLITSLEFGERNFGLNWSVLVCASALGPWLFRPFQSWVYTSNTADSDGSCYGTDCYENLWIFTTGASAVVVVLVALFDRIVARRQSQFEYAQVQSPSDC